MKPLFFSKRVVLAALAAVTLCLVVASVRAETQSKILAGGVFDRFYTGK